MNIDNETIMYLALIIPQVMFDLWILTDIILNEIEKRR